MRIIKKERRDNYKNIVTSIIKNYVYTVKPKTLMS